VRIWGSKQGAKSLDEILHLQMEPAVFPIPLTAVSAALSVEEVRPGSEFTVGGGTFRASAMQIRHPGTTLAYRLVPVAGGRSMAYVTDNELGSGGSYETSLGWRRELVRFLNGVDLLIHDAMYTPAELDSHRGWGHSSYEEAVELAAEAGVNRLVLFHHEPEHDDGAMDTLLAAAQRVARQHGGKAPLEVVAAQEGMKLSL
jgi:ribonuclease BN (tRNA processing enzyme)